MNRCNGHDHLLPFWQLSINRSYFKVWIDTLVTPQLQYFVFSDLEKAIVACVLKLQYSQSISSLFNQLHNSQGWTHVEPEGGAGAPPLDFEFCLLYTSDAADEEDSVDLGGRRIIK